MDELAFLVWREQLERGNRIGRILLENVPELCADNRNKRLIPSTQSSGKEVAALKRIQLIPAKRSRK